MDRAGSTAQYLGHTFNSDIVVNMEEVMNKVRNHEVDDAADKISIDFENQSKGTLSVRAQLKRLNFPQNCYNVNLEVNRARAGTVRTIWMDFKTGKVNKVVKHPQGKTLASNREI